MVALACGDQHVSERLDRPSARRRLQINYSHTYCMVATLCSTFLLRQMTPWRSQRGSMQVQASWLIILAAPIIGSFLGVLIRRLPEGRPIAFARSRCDACANVLTASELVPLASYVLQRGRCRHCGAAIQPFYPIIEGAAVLVAAWAILAEADPARQWLDCALGWTLLTLSWIDFRCMWLPDVLT
ncbi:MAG TPA: prepilin peptidase, partial [Acetobacteraceae bacterium]|nr:prepilin peptidase [Acetobacteraceae bacterium]